MANISKERKEFIIQAVEIIQEQCGASLDQIMSVVDEMAENENNKKFIKSVK